MKYLVKTEWSGYSRGGSVYEVEAESAAEAMENWWAGELVERWAGELVERVVVRDDTENEPQSATEKTT